MFSGTFEDIVWRLLIIAGGFWIAAVHGKLSKLQDRFNKLNEKNSEGTAP